MADEITVDVPIITVVLPLMEIDVFIVLFTDMVILLLETVAVPEQGALLVRFTAITSPFAKVALL